MAGNLITHDDEEALLMRRCLYLASKGIRYVAPNPMVGAVVTYNHEILSEGYHEKFGDYHAEANAIKPILSHPKLSASTLYVNLEPCCHTGKTPPCSDLILKSGIKNVVIGITDVDSRVQGKGIEILRSNGINVSTNILKEESLFCNRRFFTYHTLQRPYIIIKWAETENGYYAPSEKIQKWITSYDSVKLVHDWRAEESAILIGTDTALIDNPRLTVRETMGRNPLRVVIDRTLRLPETLNVFNHENNTVLIYDKMYAQSKHDKNRYVRKYPINFARNVIDQILKVLYEEHVLSVIIEGGLKLTNSFIKSGYYDEIRILRSHKTWPNGRSAPNKDLIQFDSLQEHLYGEETILLLFQNHLKKFL
jgi:diaminohydroxyphosphoribosylaminopyrimidine deaminase / 5-amino-6-(5-phosphoribosylamino)uracil reductase